MPKDVKQLLLNELRERFGSIKKLQNSISPASAERWNKELTHSQVQTLLGSIGARKGHNIWLPRNDRNKMDWNLARRFEFFEIEHSTPIYSGLLRFNDVRVLMPTLQT